MVNFSFLGLVALDEFVCIHWESMYMHYITHSLIPTYNQGSIPMICFRFRAMETVVHQNGIDIEALKSARPPLNSQNQAGDSTGNV